MINSEELINKVKTYNKFLNPEKLSKAYNYAVKAHENQKRDSGDPYSNHPIAVASILSELELDSATIVTGLLHDTIEDTFATYETIKDEFGDEVADLVDGGKVISLEPQKLVYYQLCGNIILNGYDNITAHNIALSDEHTNLKMENLQYHSDDTINIGNAHLDACTHLAYNMVDVNFFIILKQLWSVFLQNVLLNKL